LQNFSICENKFYINARDVKYVTYIILYRVLEKSGNGQISWKRNVSEKNVSNQSCRISKDLFTGAISLTLALPRSEQGHLEYFKWDPLFFITYSCSLSRELSKTL